MNSDQLKPGDLIFSFNCNNEAEHLAMYAGSKNGVPYVLHATSKPHNAVMLTHLTDADEGCEYRVMRAVDTELALDAKHILLTWVEHLVPFASVEKRDAIFNLIDRLGGVDTPQAGLIQEHHGKKTYEMNYSQYLLMANHLPYIPISYTKEEKVEGLRCTEAVIAAFNIALLMMHATQIEDKWIIEHVASLGEFVAELDNPLPFDAKESLPTGVYKHCADSTLHWENHGVLTITPYPKPDSIGKADWREFKASLEAVAIENTAQFLASPKGSPAHHDLSLYMVFNPAAVTRTSPQNLRARSASSSSVDFGDEGRPKSRLRESPIYCTFFTNESAKAATDSSSVFIPLDDRMPDKTDSHTTS